MTNRKLDCLSCKIISITALLSVGTYLFYLGRSQKRNYKYTLFTLGIVSSGLGIGEMFDKSPFRENSTQ